MLGAMRLASHLHLPLQVVLNQTTSTEFILWMDYLDEEEKRYKKLDLYLARLIGETRRSWVSKPKDVDDTIFLIPPIESKPSGKKLDGKAKLEQSKNFWFAVTGVSNKKKMIKKKKRK